LPLSFEPGIAFLADFPGFQQLAEPEAFDLNRSCFAIPRYSSPNAIHALSHHTAIHKINATIWYHIHLL
jgi:hypothetical protein